MKKTFIAVLLAIFLPICVSASFNASQWKYFKDISGVGGELTKVAIDDEVFSGTKKDLSDVRVIDGEGKEITFKLLSGKSVAKRDSYPVRILNNSYSPGKNSSAILDLGEKGKIANSVEIDTQSSNFQKNVVIYGSDDLTNWSVLKENAYIYDYTDNRAKIRSRNTLISFPESLFRYLMVEISDENNDPVKIGSVSVFYDLSEQKKENSREIGFDVLQNDVRKTTELVADMGLDGIPVGKITLLIFKDSNFNRGVVIYSSSDKENWKVSGQAYIFRYSTSKFSGGNLTINFPETNSRYIKLEIFNNDNSPLTVDGLTAYSELREVAFQPEIGKNYRIYYGDTKANYPRYDLEKFFQYLDIENAKTGSLDSQKNNPGYIPEKEPVKPMSERIPYLFPAIIILTSLILLFLVYKFLRAG